MALTKGLPKVRIQEQKTRIGNLLSGVPEYIYSGSRQSLLLSYGHPKWDRPSAGASDFYQVTQNLDHYGGITIPWARNGLTGLNRCLGVSPGYTSMPSPTFPSFASLQSELHTHAATGFKRARPGNPVASLGQFVIELRDLPQRPFKRLFTRSNSLKQMPRLLLKELTDFRNLGSEYLNVVFGWKPFVNDLRQMYNLYKTIDKRIAQLVRENGKDIRRKVTIKTDVTTTTDSKSYPFHGVNLRGHPGTFLPSSCPSGTTYTYTETVKEKIWYVGNFRYYIPDTSSSQWNARARAALFGALPTPELLWQVLPWTWLIDWFSNVGDVISNVSPNAVDNLVTTSAFLMKKIELSRMWHATTHSCGVSSGANVWPSGSTTSSTVYHQVTKLRAGGGNPFGMGVQLNSLSSGQLGILAALGLSRSRVR